MFINIEYEYTDKLKRIKQILNIVETNHTTVALDFETTGLDNPRVETITHLSLAISSLKSYVFIVKNNLIRNYLLKWLVSTDIKQLWHNFIFDGKYIYYYTNQLPKDYEDTQLLAKTLLNHVEKYKAKVGLKELCAGIYGNWGIDEANFTIDNMYNEKLLKYAAIDSCATYYLWEEMNKSIGE